MTRRVLVPVCALMLIIAACSDEAPEDAEPASTTSGPPPPIRSATPEPETSAPLTTAYQTTEPPGPPPPPPTPLAGRVIVVDPGHNGANGEHPEEINRPVDAGGFEKACNTTGAATNAGISESSINWTVAQLVRDRLEDLGATVILTRTSDDGWGPCIDERGQTAARNRADLLLSVHADGAGSADHGFHVIHPGVVAGYTESSYEASVRLGQELRDSLERGGLVPSTYIGQDGLVERTDLGTLNRAEVPAAMVEAGNPALLRRCGTAIESRRPSSRCRQPCRRDICLPFRRLLTSGRERTQAANPRTGKGP